MTEPRNLNTRIARACPGLEEIVVSEVAEGQWTIYTTQDDEDGRASEARVIGWVHYEPDPENEHCQRAVANGKLYHAIPREGTLSNYHYANPTIATHALVFSGGMFSE